MFLFLTGLAWTESGSCSSPEKAERGELAAQGGRVGEGDAVHAERARRRGVARVVVDIDRLVRHDGEALEEQMIYARIGLDVADLARDQHAAEPGEEIEAAERQRISLRRPV